jgi:rhodanese-related sulfurtransferase
MYKIVLKGLVFSFLLTMGTINLFADKAENIGILTKDDRVFTIKKDGKDFDIKRVMTPCAKNKGWIQPLTPHEGVTPITELEILDALKNESALLVDMRIGNAFATATIPNAINIPFNEAYEHLDKLGCVMGEDDWDCSKGVKMISFCNGPICPQSAWAIKVMLENGYPVENISYYRGGMLDWSALGFTTVRGK